MKQPICYSYIAPFFSETGQSSCSLTAGKVNVLKLKLFLLIGRIDKQWGWLHSVGVGVWSREDHDGALEYLSVTFLIWFIIPFLLSVLYPWAWICLRMYCHHSWNHSCNDDNAQEPPVWMWHNPPPSHLIRHSDNCHHLDDSWILRPCGWEWSSTGEN